MKVRSNALAELGNAVANLAARPDAVEVSEALRATAGVVRAAAASEYDLLAVGVLLETSRAVALLGLDLGQAREIAVLEHAEAELRDLEPDDFNDPPPVA